MDGRRRVRLQGLPLYVNDRAMCGVHPSLDDAAPVLAMGLEHLIMVVASEYHWKLGPLCHLDILRNVLVRQGKDFSHLGVMSSQSFDGLWTSVKHRDDRFVSLAEGLFSVHRRPLAAAYAKPEEADFAGALGAVLSGERPDLMLGQLRLELGYVRVQPLALELLDPMDQLRRRDVVPIMVAEAYHVDGHVVQHLHHREPSVQRTQQRRREEIARQNSEHILGRKAFRFLRDQGPQRRQIIKLVHIADTEDPHSALWRSSGGRYLLILPRRRQPCKLRQPREVGGRDLIVLPLGVGSRAPLVKASSLGVATILARRALAALVATTGGTSGGGLARARLRGTHRVVGAAAPGPRA
mmetsp:Transcript_79006/g.228400  ORF Transcript_79006/g.228400 Transcript_79006/m.228400 type:complete len:353 (-) Transcript_79006:2-1060(-)